MLQTQKINENSKLNIKWEEIRTTAESDLNPSKLKEFWEEVEYKFDQVKSFLRINFIRAPKYAFQRFLYGWDDSETWDLDSVIMPKMIEKLKRLSNFSDNDLVVDTLKVLQERQNQDLWDIDEETYEEIKKAIWTYFFWFIDEDMIDFLYPRIKRFRKITISHPVQDTIQTMDDWYKVLDEIIALLQDLQYQEGRIKVVRELGRLADLMYEYFFCLWW